MAGSEHLSPVCAPSASCPGRTGIIQASGWVMPLAHVTRSRHSTWLVSCSV